MSVVRYLSVCKALTSQKWTEVSNLKKIVTAIYIICFLFNFPRYFRGKVIWNEKANKYRLVENEFGHSWWYNIFYWTILNYIASLILPTIIMLFTTTKLLLSLHVIKTKKAKMTSSVTSQPRDDITISLIAMVITFIILNFQNPLRRLLIAIHGNELTQCDNKYYHATNISTSHILNSSANFVCYILLSKKFRKRIFNLLHLRRSTIHPEISTTHFS